MNAPVRTGRIPEYATDDLSDRTVILLEHETDWGRNFRARLMSWGVDVVIGPQAPMADLPPLIVMSEQSFASRVMRDRLSIARASLPEAPLLVITTPEAGTEPWSGGIFEQGDLTACLRAAGLGFVCEVNA